MIKKMYSDKKTTISHQPFVEAAIKSKIILQAALVGLISGFLVILFRLCIEYMLGKITGLAAGMELSRRMMFLPGIAAAGGLVSGLLVCKFAPETKGSGIPYVKMALARMGNVTRIRSIFVKFFAGIAGIGAGLSLGREGPSVQLGAGAGALVSRIFRIKGTSQDKLIAAGAGSAIAATFNAPIAGAVFVIEELVNRFSAGLLLPVLMATVCAASLSRHFLGDSPSFILPSIPNAGAQLLPAAILLGVIAGIAGKLFSKSIFASQKIYSLLTFIPNWAKPAIAGVLIGIAGCFLPEILGPGNAAADSLFRGEFTLRAAAIIFLAKFLATPLCFGSGAAGGIFLPMLMLGSFLGWICGALLSAAGMSADPSAMSLMGMAAFLAAVGRTPMTAVVMVFEMTGGYSLILPIMLCAATADFIAERLGNGPIYSELILKGEKNGSAAVLSALKVKDYFVPGGPLLNPSMSVESALDECRSRGLTTLTVCDSSRRVAGTVSWHELEDFLYQGNSGKEPLSKAMNPEAEIIFPDDDLYSAYYRLHSSGGGSLVVTDRKLRVQGVLTRKELSRALGRNRDMLTTGRVYESEKPAKVAKRADTGKRNKK